MRAKWRGVEYHNEVEFHIGSNAQEALYRNRNFLLLWCGQFVSQMGDRIAAVALPWLVYRHTGSALGTGLVLALYTLPYVLLGTIAGVLVDRVNKRTLMMLTDAARGLLMLAVPLLAEVSLVAVYVLAFMVASLAVLFDPAKLAIVPEIVSAPRLLRANSLLSTAENVTEVVGYGFAGILLASVSTLTAFRIDALTYAGSAAALAFMAYHPAHHAIPSRARSVAQDARDALLYLGNHRGLLANTLISVAAAAGAGATYPLIFLFAVRELDGGPKAFGYLEAALGLGFFIGSLALAGAARRVRKGTTMIVGLTLTGTGVVLMALTTSMWSAAAVLLLVGVVNASALIAIDTFVQEAVPERLRGRVWGTRLTLTQGTYALAVLVTGGFAGIIDLRTLFVISGALIAVPALVGAFVEEIRRG